MAKCMAVNFEQDVMMQLTWFLISFAELGIRNDSPLFQYWSAPFMYGMNVILSTRLPGLCLFGLRNYLAFAAFIPLFCHGEIIAWKLRLATQ